MSELTLTLLRLGYLALLWLLVLAIVGVLRSDLYGTQVRRRATRAPRAPRTPAASPGTLAATGRSAPRSLVVTAGSLKGTTLALGQAPVLIGRAPECTLVLDDDYASGHHARLSPQDDGWLLEDLDSTNGTFLGRSKVVGSAPIQAGTPVRIGRTVLELRR
jgi:pSer/pThr/pTyr-binding forkhead associated (FHA) protein